MLRLLVLVLVAAQGAWWAWSQDLLRPWGLGPVPQAEPQRVSEQIRPEAVRVVHGDEARRLAEAPPPQRAPDCLMTGPIQPPVAAALRQGLADWPAGSWSLEPGVEPARWIVYMGEYPNAQMLERKKAELRRRGVSFEPVVNSPLAPGLSLGSFTSQAAANAKLKALAAQGVQSARVVQERPEQRGLALRLPAVDDSLRPRLDEVRSALGGRALLPCR